MAFGKFAKAASMISRGSKGKLGGGTAKRGRFATAALSRTKGKGKGGGGGGGKGAGPRQRIAKMRASGNKSGAYKAIRRLRKKC